jgi:hypothetical protein
MRDPDPTVDELRQARQDNKQRQRQQSQGNGVGQPAVRLEDFVAYMPQHSYIFAPSREPWPAGSVNARIPPIPLFDAQGQPVLTDKGEQKTIPASVWLDQHRPVEQATWLPGAPESIKNRLISEGGWIERQGTTVFNLYRPPALVPRNAAQADKWIDHVHRVYPNDADHVIRWLAHRVQRPQDKINHALVLGGLQGIGKDTLLEPVKRAVGPWNVSEVSPQHLLGRFNGFLKSVILRISEAHDLGEVNRFSFYDHMKAYTAAPPDVLRVDEKNLRILRPKLLRRHHHHQPQMRRHLPARRRPPPLRRMERPHQGRFRGRLLDHAVALV